MFLSMALTSSDSVGGGDRIRPGDKQSMAFWRCRDRLELEEDEAVETFKSRTYGIRGVGLGNITKLFSMLTAGVLDVVGTPGFSSKIIINLT